MIALTPESLKFDSPFWTLGCKPRALMGLIDRLHAKGLVGNPKLKVWKPEPVKPESES